MEENVADTLLSIAEVLRFLGKYREANICTLCSVMLRAKGIATCSELEDVVARAEEGYQPFEIPAKGLPDAEGARTESVDHPPHYNEHPSGVEAIDVCEGVSFCLGNAIKYLWRAGRKGSVDTDMRKALWYLRRLAQYSSPGPTNEELLKWASAEAKIALAHEKSGPLHNLLSSIVEKERSRELIDEAIFQLEEATRAEGGV